MRKLVPILLTLCFADICAAGTKAKVPSASAPTSAPAPTASKPAPAKRGWWQIF